MEREFINSTGASKSIPRGYSHVATVRNPGASVFLAGQGPVDENLKLVGGGDIEAQIRATFHDIKRDLEAARASIGDIVKMVIYVSDIANQQWPVRNVRAQVVRNHVVVITDFALHWPADMAVEDRADRQVLGPG